MVRPWLWLALAAAALLAAAPPAAAATDGPAPFDGQLQAGGLVDMAGRLEGATTLRHALLLEGHGDVVAVEGDLAVEFVQERIVAGIPQATARLPSDPMPARAVQVAAAAGATVLLSSEGLEGALDAPALRLRPYADDALPLHFMPAPDPWRVVPNGGCAIADGAPQALTGPVKLLVHAATVTVDGQAHPTGDTASGPVRDTTFAVVTATRATVRLAPDAAWRSCAHAWDLQLNGTFLVQDVRYAADLGPGYVAGDEARFAAEGELHLQGHQAGDGSLWRIQGTVASATAGDTPLWATTAAVAATAAAGAGALGFAAWLLAALRARPFDNGNRVRILERIRQEPGITIHALHAGTGLATTTVRFHLRVLSRDGLVQGYRQGIREHYVAHGAAASRLARARAALLQHPVRARLHATLAAAGKALDYPALRLAWEAAGEEALSRPLAEYHLKLMMAQGLVERVGPGVRWRLAAEAPAPTPLAAPVPAAPGVPA